MLLAAGAHPNARRDDDITALIVAIDYGHAEIAKMLLVAGAHPNAAQDDGMTSLMFASIRGHAEIAKMLLAAGAFPNSKKKQRIHGFDVCDLCR